MLAHNPASIPNFLLGAPPPDPSIAAVLTVDGEEFARCPSALAADLAQDAITERVADHCLGTFIWNPHFSAYVLRSATFVGGAA